MDAKLWHGNILLKIAKKLPVANREKKERCGANNTKLPKIDMTTLLPQQCTTAASNKLQ
jgi:hypothetical protein